MKSPWKKFTKIVKYLNSFITRNATDFEAVYAESQSNKPVLLLYSEESETVKRIFTNFACTKVGSKYTIVDVNSLGLPEEKKIKKHFAKPMLDVNDLHLKKVF